MFGMVELLFLPVLLLLLLPLGLALFAFWIWMLIHATQNKGLREGEKVAWLLIIVLVHFLGALIYFFVGRPKANRIPTNALPVA